MKEFPSCNGYDLAAITQLTCTVPADEFGNECVDSSRVFRFLTSFVSMGYLYGWVVFGGGASPV